MDISALRAFVEAASTGNLTVASEALGLSQSALSKRIASLEAEFGGRLFARTGRGVRLTAFGHEILPQAIRLLHDLAELEGMGRRRSSVPTGDVKIGIAPPMTRLIAPPLYREVSRLYPEVRLTISGGFTNILRKDLMHGALDIAILNRFVRGAVEGETVLGEYGTFLLGSRAKAATMAPEIPFSEMAKVPLVLPTGDNEMRRAIDAMARRMGTALNVVLAVDSAPLMYELVKNTECHTLTMAHTPRNALQSEDLVVSLVVDPELRRRVVMEVSTVHPPSLAVRSITTLLRRIFSEVMSTPPDPVALA